MFQRQFPLQFLAVLLALAAGVGELVALQVWRVRDRMAGSGSGSRWTT
ncbi:MULTISPECIES: hypothetical protein [Ramlibacter]|uniref:Uncharacterized protein n=1 Tax=Ramlibacter pinisoli TaxID=2682844 RepID=A0A6N8IXE0_9BURK|nr:MULTISPECIES: hypothetical protein [Ramlibacter]MBA2961291.1 hypothetical protein [Ramlibacter sp. CGMCC 1.13660]MVQ31235.1 hypothetical protein [Ramlibacter pinisoli]